MRIPERQAELDALTRKYLDEPRTEETRRPTYTAPSKGDEEIIAKARAENGGKLDRLWGGDLSDYDHDASSADDGFVHKLWSYTQDEEQVRRIHAISGLHRPEKSGKRPDYLQRSINRARKNVEWFYEWPDDAKLEVNGKADLRTTPENKVSLSPSLKGQGHQGHPVPDDNHGGKLPRAAAFRELDEPEERRYLVAGLVPASYPTMIFGDGGSAKSLLAMSLGTAIATGAAWLGHKVMKTSVLYLDFELDASEQSRRSRQVARGAGLQEPPADFYYLSALGYPVRDAFRAAYVECRARGIGMLILDSLGPALEGDAEASRDVIGFYSRVMEPFRALGTGVFMVDHQAKLQAGERYQSKRAFGSVFKTNLARSVVQVEARDREEGRLAATLRQTKHNFGYRTDPFGVVVEFSEEAIAVSPEKLDPADLAEEGTINSTDRVRLVLEDGPAYPVQIAEATGLAVKTVKNALTRLRKAGEVAPTGNVEHQAEQVSLVSLSLKGQGQGHLRITKEDAPLSSDHKPGESATPEQQQRIRKLVGAGMSEKWAREEVLGSEPKVVSYESGKPYDEYVGRGKRGTNLKKSKWHNPFVEGDDKDGTREEVIAKFERYLEGPVENYEGKVFDGRHLKADLHELRGKTLCCHCAPEICHADHLLKLANANVSGDSTKHPKGCLCMECLP